MGNTKSPISQEPIKREQSLDCWNVNICLQSSQGSRCDKVGLWCRINDSFRPIKPNQTLLQTTSTPVLGGKQIWIFGHSCLLCSAFWTLCQGEPKQRAVLMPKAFRLICRHVCAECICTGDCGCFPSPWLHRQTYVYSGQTNDSDQYFVCGLDFWRI